MSIINIIDFKPLVRIQKCIYTTSEEVQCDKHKNDSIFEKS